MKIGDTVYWFDQNKRVYRKSMPGDADWSGPPIWREHFRAFEITGETSRSWITNQGHKLPKNGPFPSGWASSVDEIDRQEWVQENRHKIQDALRKLSFADLAAVAKLIGYQPAAPTKEPA